MEKKDSNKPFNPFLNFTLTRVLSIVAPDLYTKEQLAQIEEIYQFCVQESSSGSSSKITMEENSMNSKRRLCSSDEDITSYDEEKGVKQEKMKKKPRKSEPTPPPELPVHVRTMIENLNGSDINYVMCKKLFATDLNSNNNRLSMPLKEIKCDHFLTESEKATLDTKKDGKPDGFEVTVLDPSFTEFTMLFKKWKMKTTCVYNLVKRWKLLLSQNSLKEGEEYYIWSFRVNDKLYLVLVNKNS